MESAYGGVRWWPSTLIKVLLALLVVWVVLSFDYPFGVPSGAEFDQSSNGAWIAARWSNSLVPPEETSALIQRFQDHGIRWIYANEGKLDTDGRLPRENFLYAGGLVESIHRAPRGRLRAVAWISGRGGDGGVALYDAGVRSRIVDTCKYLVQQLDFDGVQLDIEPVPSGDLGFLKLLEELREGIGSKTISVAAVKWTPLAPRIGGSNLAPYSWDDDYYHQVAMRADQVALITYDSGIPLSNLYIKYAGWQTSQVLDSLSDVPTCRVLIGIPTYNERTFWHPGAENLGSGLQGVIEALRDFRRTGSMPTNFEGVAIYDESSTSPQEWATFDKVWRGKP